jgi:hypothetical protein
VGPTGPSRILLPWAPPDHQGVLALLDYLSPLVDHLIALSEDGPVGLRLALAHLAEPERDVHAVPDVDRPGELPVPFQRGDVARIGEGRDADEHTILQVTEIAKQNEGWLKSQGQGHGQNRRAMPEGKAAPGAARRPAARLDAALKSKFLSPPLRSQRAHLGLDPAADSILGAVQIVSALQVEPVLGRLAEEPR